MEDYDEAKLLSLLKDNEGNDSVSIYVKATRQIKKLPAKWMIDASSEFVEKLRSVSVGLAEKVLEDEK